MRERLQNRRVVTLGLVLVGLTVGCCLLTVLGWTTGLLRSLDTLFLRESATTQASTAVAGPFILAIDHTTGDIEVVPDGVDEIVVEVTTRARALADAERVEATLTREDEVVTLELSGADSDNLIVDLQIHTPPETALRLRQGAGNVAVEGLRGSLEIESGAGDVTVRDHEAAEVFSIQSGTGSVEVSLASMAESTMLTVNSGVNAVALSVPGDTGFQLDVSTGTGEINLDDDFQFETLNRDEAGSRQQVRGTLEPVEGRTLTIEIGTGDFTLRER